MSSARSLDDLDRLSFRLARVIRQQYPQLSSQGFTLIDLEERLLPFRETRRVPPSARRIVTDARARAHLVEQLAVAGFGEPANERRARVV